MKINKKLTKTILLSSLAIAAFGSVAAGSTYALFTSKAEETVTVSTGKVSVEQEVAVKECYRPTLIDTDGSIKDDNNSYDEETGFIATIDGDEVIVTNMVPGDKVTLTVTPTNNSNVKIKYRETYKIEGDNEGILNIVAEDNMVTHWTAIEANGVIEAYEVSIEVPSTVTKGVENAKITLGVEAVQGNAKVYDVEVSTAEELRNVLEATGEDISVMLDNDIALTESIEVISNNVTIIGDGTTTISVPEDSYEGRVLNIDADSYGTLGIEKKISLNLVGVNVEGPTENNYNRGISIWGMDEVDVILDSCTVTANHYPLNIAAKNKKVDLKVRNCTLAGYTAFQSWSDVSATFENCTLVGENVFGYDADHYNDFAIINLVGGVTENGVEVQYAVNADLTFKGCKFYSYARKETSGDNIGKYNEESILTVGRGMKGNVSFEGCEFYATVGESDINKPIEASEVVEMCGVTQISDDDLDNYFTDTGTHNVKITIK